MLTSFLELLGKPKGGAWVPAHHEILPERKADLQPLPEELDPRVSALVGSAGISSLYAHQAEAVRLALESRNVVICTATASGKTLAYQLPVLDRLMRDDSSHALLLFPLKALERDQRDAFLALAGHAGMTAAVYDGDTPEAERRKIRARPPRVLITNPDMLHLSILSHHDTWKDFFGNLAYVVLDEVHAYKGIFGSHISQLLMRTRRICDLHGSRPGFIACSATVANPAEFVSRLLGEEVSVVDRSGAPSSQRHFVFVDPVLSPYTVASRLFVSALEMGLKSIVFTRARRITELITTWVINEAPHLRNRVSSYRAGFLPEERREIESRLFSGKMDGVISTSALEMGIDVGGLDVCILVGYPGTVINTWQRGGRVGRGSRPSAIVLIAGADALDRYFLRNPQDFFGRNCEEAVLDPLNEEVLKRHLPCAAAERPLHPDEPLLQGSVMEAVLSDLTESGALYMSAHDGAWHSSSRFPHRQVDLRAIGDSYPIFLEDGKTMIGSSSGGRAFSECHEGAVYLHRAKQYEVTRLDLERRNIQVRPSRLGYYTRALSEKDTKILGVPLRSRALPGFVVREARLKVTERITGYEKRRTSDQTQIGAVDLSLPPTHFETVGIWIEVPDEVKEAIQRAGINFMGGIHALEHAAIAMFPLFALCDRDDIGGISTPEHEQVCRAAVFIYDGHPGGVGLAHRAFDVIEDLLERTEKVVETCPCEDGCPSCIHSPKCGSGNKPLDKAACLSVLRFLMDPEKLKAAGPARNRSKPLIFPDLPKGLGSRNAGVSSRKQVVARSTGEPVSAADRSRDRAAPRPTDDQTEQTKEIQVMVKDPVPPTLVTNSGRRIVIFDLETRKLADEVGGWKHIAKMLLALAVTYTDEEGFRTYTEETVHDLVESLKTADLVVGFNHVRFDYEVLRAYTDFDLRKLPNLDILQDVHAVLGHRLKLDHLAKFTLGRKKTADGLEAARWFREGKVDLVEEYCREDVAITRDLYQFGATRGYLLYQPKGRKTSRIPVQWEVP